MFAIHRILHPTDFSEQSQAAFEVAAALAHDYSAELILLHVWSPPKAYAPDGIAMPMPYENPYQARQHLADLTTRDPHVKLRHIFLEGDPVEQILHLAHEEEVDMIAMGTHGSSGLTRLLMGSVAEGVSRKATCPVVTLRQPSSKADVSRHEFRTTPAAV